MTRFVLALAACGWGCIVPVAVGSGPCGRLVMTEVMTSGEFWTFAGGRDWVELENIGDVPASLDLFRLGLTTDRTHPEILQSIDVGQWHVIEPGERIAVVASTYHLDPIALGWPTVALDMNNDESAIDLFFELGPGDAESCQHVYVPDQHSNFSQSWQFAEERWCPTEATPAEENASCYCDGNPWC